MKMGATPVMSIRDTVLEGIRTVATDQNVTLTPLTDDCGLLETGLDSLDFVLVATHLREVTGCDPLASVSTARFPWTVGELIALYEEETQRRFQSGQVRGGSQ